MSSPTTNHSATNAGHSAPPLDLGDFLERCMGNTTVALLVLDKFERQLQTDIRDIADRITSQDAEHIARTAHALKGSAGAAAAATLQRLAANVELLARQNQVASVAQELSALRAEVDRCLGYLPTARGALGNGPMNESAPETTR